MSLTPAQLATFKAELQSDPKALGYAAKLAVGDQGGVAALVNLVHATGGDFEVPNEPVSPSTVMAQVTPDDFSAMSSSDHQRLQTLFILPTLDLNNANVFANLSACFPNPGNTRTNLANLSKRQGTRGEVLFQVNGIRVTANDVSNALAS